MAIAAGVAAVAVFTMQPTGQSDLGAVSTPATRDEPACRERALGRRRMRASSYVAPTSTSQSAFIPATRLTNYVVAHSEYSSPPGRRSVLSGVLADDEEAQALESGEAEVKISNGDDVVSGTLMV